MPGCCCESGRTTRFLLRNDVMIEWFLSHLFQLFVMVPLSLAMGVANVYAYRKEGEHQFTNNYAEQLTEKVIEAHDSRLRTLKVMLCEADESAMLELVNSPGMSTEWPKTVDEMGVPWIYWMTFWLIPHVCPVIAEFTRIRVRFRVERFLDNPLRGQI